MGPGNENLRTAGGAADIHHIHLHVLALHQFLAGDLLAGEQQGLSGLRAGADPQGHGVGAGVDPGHHAGEDLVLLGVELVIYHAALRFTEALDNDLLAVAGSDAAKLRVVHRDVHHVADLVFGGNGLGLLNGDLVEGVHIVLLRHHVLLHVHLQPLMFLIHVHNDVFHVLVVPLVGGGDSLDDLIHHEGLGDAPFLFQHSQSCEDLRDVHTRGFLHLFLAFHCDSPFYFIRLFLRQG